MKKNKKIVLSLILLLMVLFTSGCGANSYIKDSDKKIVSYKKTGQNLQSNIYCKPSEGTEVYKLYEKYNDQLEVSLDKLPTCDKFTITYNKTNSLWQFLFVKPLAFIILKLGLLFKNMGLKNAYLGLSVMIIGLLIRVILLPFTIKTQGQSEKIKKAQPEIQKIERKYANDNSKEGMLLKSQEMSAIYKKYKINPMTSCLLAFIQLPIFFAFLEAIYRIPTIYEGKIFGWNLGTTPNVGIFQNHQYTYIILVILIVLSTYFSFKYSMSQTSQMSNDSNMMMGGKNQTNYMLIGMTIFIGFASLSLPTAIALYWIVTYSFMFLQTTIIKLINNKKHPNDKRSNMKERLKIKEGLKYGKNN